MATGLVKTRKARVQDPEANPKGGGLLLRVSLFLRMDATWLITRSLADGAVVRREPLRGPKAGLRCRRSQFAVLATLARRVDGSVLVQCRECSGEKDFGQVVG